MNLHDAAVRVPALDGIRGIAILAVLIFHYAGFPGSTLVERLGHKVLAAGWLGVDLFFVLSGFLITGILLDTKLHTGYYRNFYIRRALRIFPLYYSVLFIAVFLVPVLTRGGLTLFQPGEQMWYWTHLSNWASARRIDVYPLTHFWSLAVEEQFYLAWPLVVAFWNRKGLAYVCAGLVVAAPLLRIALIYFWDSGSTFAYRITPTRMDSLAFGGLAALAAQSGVRLPRLAEVGKKAAIAALALLATTALAAKGLEVDKHLVVALAPSFAAAIFAYYVLLAGTGRLSASVSRRLSNPYLISFGKYSYAIYILHWPIQLVLYQYLGFLTNQDHFIARIFGTMGYLLIGTALSYAVARLSWWALEERFLRWRSVFAPRPAARSCIGVAAAAD